MKYLIPILLICGGILFFSSAIPRKPVPPFSPKKTPDRPNIILYLADDLGWGDLGCYGQEKIHTPHLDQMAREGMRFTQAYCGSPVCASSRSTLMQGLHGGNTYVRNNKTFQGELLPFNNRTQTLAKLLKKAGYTTGLFGKWGLGEALTSGIPNHQGFDQFYGFLNQRNAHHYYVDSLWTNQQKVPVNLDPKRQYASADWYLDQAKSFIRQQAQNQNPFFAYIPTQLPHLYMPYSPDTQYQDQPWPEGDKRYATMISRIDQQMGEIIRLVDSLNLSENTLILFLSDNGGGNGQRIFYHDVRFFRSNANFRGMKRDLYEGGIRVPLLARWLKTIPQGQVSEEPVVYYDLMETFGDILNLTVEPSDGESLLPLLTGATPTLSRKYLYWEFPYLDIPNAKFAVRMGDWKGVKEYEKMPLQLYNIKNDPGELYNWAKEHPDIVAEMEKIIHQEHTPSPYWPLKSEQ